MASQTPPDESLPRVSIWRLVLLSAAGGAVNIGYAAEEGYAVPLIQAAGIPLKYTTLCLAFSPIIGMFFQPFLGAFSDQCTCSWGKRKPFILSLCIMAVFGCAAPYFFFLQNVNISDVVFKPFVIVFIVLLDFSIGALQLPCRAFLLDVVPVSQSQTGNFIYSIAIAVDSALGFFLGAIDWSVIAGEGFGIEYQAQIVFGLAAIFIFLSMISTLVSISEKPTRNDEHLQVKQNNIIYSSATAANERNKLLHESNKDTKNLVKVERNTKCCSCCCCLNFNLVSLFVNCFRDIFSFIYHMSFNMWLLWLVTLFGFLGEFSFVFGFTTFVGTVVYEGDHDADQGSEKYELYAKGIRMGSLTLALSSIVGAILSISLDYITKWIRLKTVFLLSLSSFVVLGFLMILLPKIYYTMVFGLCYGPLLVVLLVFPFALIPVYEKEGLLFRMVWPNAPDVIEGKACSVINTAIFLGQIGASLLVGPVVEATGSNVYFITIPSVAVSVALIISVFVQTRHQ